MDVIFIFSRFWCCWVVIKQAYASAFIHLGGHCSLVDSYTVSSLCQLSNKRMTNYYTVKPSFLWCIQLNQKLVCIIKKSLYQTDWSAATVPMNRQPNITSRNEIRPFGIVVIICMFFFLSFFFVTACTLMSSVLNKRELK